MNKKISVIQFLIGFGSILLLWCIGTYTYSSYSNNLDISPKQSFYYLVTPVTAVMLILYPFYCLYSPLFAKENH